MDFDSATESSSTIQDSRTNRKRSRSRSRSRSGSFDRGGTRDNSSNSSTDSNSISSSSNSGGSNKIRKKKHKKEHKEKTKHKKKKESKKKKKKKKNEKRDKDKKKRKKVRIDKSSMQKSTAVDQHEYGKFGIIKEENFFSKQREFEAYMAEVKGIPGILCENKREIMINFKSFMEDYNTATMPHDKFYDYEKWEIAEYEKKRKQSSSDYIGETHEDYIFNDEYLHKLKKQNEKKEIQNREFEKIKFQMSLDKNRQDSMRRQTSLQTELQAAYKRGDTETVKRLEKLLTPEDQAGKTAIKHPWAS